MPFCNHPSPIAHCRLSWQAWLLLAWLFAASAWGNSNPTADNLLASLGQQLDAAETAFLQTQGNQDIRRLDSLNATATELERQAQSCISEQEQEQAQTQQSLDSLGEPKPDEASEIKQKRKELQAQRQQIEKTLAQCRLLGLRAATLGKETQTARQTLLRAQLFARHHSVWDYVQHWRDVGAALHALGSHALALLVPREGGWSALAYGLGGLLLGWAWRWRTSRHYRNHLPALHDTSPTLTAVWFSLVRLMPLLLAGGFALLALYTAPAANPLWMPLLQVLLLFALGYYILRSLLRHTAQVENVAPADQRAARRLRFWAHWLLLAWLLGVFLQPQGLDNLPTDPGQPNAVAGLLRMAVGTLAGFAAARLIWLLASHFQFLQRTRLHLLSSLTLMAATISLWLGYRNFSAFLFTGVFGTLFVLLGAWLILKGSAETFEGLDKGRAAWQRRWRGHLGLQAGQPVPGVLWLRLSITVAVAGGVLVALLRLWGLPEHTLSTLLGQLAYGFSIAGMTIEPLRLLGGLLVVAFLISLTHVFKKNLAEHWLTHTTLSHGVRAAIVTVAGYGGGVALAILLGLTVAGIQLQNLAIIAGALSVGIGFGLQNIVNNFVSGLILLFERPVRIGDWIKVGNVEGYVREISIRSTIIQTFERSEVILPNSELITKPVDNMMLHDRSGRVIVRVTVAHGSDPDQVLAILAEVAQQHPEVLQPPTAKHILLLREITEAGLVFELRCFVSDVEKRLRVTSELNLAIVRALYRQGIPLGANHAHPTAKTADLG